MFVVVLFCLAFSFCQIALAFLCWMLITVGFYFGLQKITRTKNRAIFNSAFALKIKAIFYANNTTYFILFHFITIIIIFFFFFFLGGGGLFCFVFVVAVVTKHSNLPHFEQANEIIDHQ